MGILAHRQNKEDMAFILNLIEAGKVKPVLDRPYKLDELAEAMRYFEEAKHKGKIVITIP